MLNRLNSPLISALVAGIIISLFILGRLYQSRFDFSSFVTAGDEFCDPARVPQGLTVLRQSAGYDGQFYYRLALNPFTSKAVEFGIRIDSPPVRQQRILYPLLAWILSLGNPALAPVVMVLINLTSLCVLGWLGGAFARTMKGHALLGLFLPLYPGFLFTLSRDLVEILEITLLLGSLFLIRRGHHAFATLLLALAVLTKETSLLVAGAALVVYLFEWWRGEEERTLKWYYFTFPIVIFLLWQLTLFRNWGDFPVLAFASGGSNFGIPFVAPAGLLLESYSLATSFQRHNFVEMLFLIGFSLTVFYHLRRTKASRLEIVACLLYAALCVSLGRSIWVEDWAFFRAAAQFCALGTIIIIISRSKIRPFVFAYLCLFWLYVFIRLIRHYS